MQVSTRIEFNTGLDFLTWLLEATDSSVQPFEPNNLFSARQPLLTPKQWLSFFHQICRTPCDAEAFYPPEPGKKEWEQLLAEYRPIVVARYAQFRAYTALEVDGRFGKIQTHAHAFEPTKVSLISLIHWHKPIHYLYEKTLVVGADIADLNFEAMDAYVQTLASDPSFRKEHHGRITCVRTKLTNLAVLKQALEQLGFTTVEHGDARANQVSMPCDLVATLPGGYDICWKNIEQGTLGMYWDVFGINQTHDAMQLVDAINQQYLLLQQA
ncbi:MAG: hypothetical protein ACAF41_12430 [Leptolyngbya sp. BL-A-14]